jgi:parallel beta-helix repeat protein
MRAIEQLVAVRRRVITKLAASLGVLGALGCGGGSSSGGAGGSLNFRPVWEQRSLHGRTTAVINNQPVSVPRGSFGVDLPAAVKTIRIAFDSDTGQRCCLAVDPTQLPIDPASGRRFLVLSDLASGAATVGLAGFATNFAPADAAVATCPSDPPGAGQACDPSRVAAPSFQSDPQRVNIISGIETAAGDIPVFAVPFLLNLGPDAGSSVPNPVAVTFTVADAASGIDPQSVNVDLTQNNQAAPSVPLTLTPCDDATSSPCSAAGELQVTGFRVVRQPQTLQVGNVAVDVHARNLAATPRTLDLRYQFSAENAAATPTLVATRTPTGAPTPGVFIVRPGSSIAATAKAAPPGSIILVAPGVYAAVELRAGDLRGPVTLVADVSGLQTNSSAAPVTINVRGSAAGIRLSEQNDVTVDGFTIRGAASAGVLVQQSAGIIVQNCTVAGTRGDGLLIDSSSNALAFDNLVFGNSGSGIQVRGSSEVRLINNTVYQNHAAGILIGDSTLPSNSILVRNNIVNLNTPTGLRTDPSTDGYDSDYNLNTDGYGADTPTGFHDIIGNIADPLFIAPAREDFHLSSGSQSPAVNAGDPAIDAEIADALDQRTTQTDGSADVSPVDLGYHYPAVQPTPTPKPKPTRTPTPTATARS